MEVVKLEPHKSIPVSPVAEPAPVAKAESAEFEKQRQLAADALALMRQFGVRDGLVGDPDPE